MVDADIVVMATGLELMPWGGISLAVDGRAIEPRDALVYKGMMLSDVPNLAWCVGYTNASWTLRADLTTQNVCRLLDFMDRHGHDVVMPHAEPGDADRRPLLDLRSGYISRAADAMPKQGARAPWYLRQNYILDFLSSRFGRIEDPSLRFSRTCDRGARSQPVAPQPQAGAAGQSVG